MKPIKKKSRLFRRRVRSFTLLELLLALVITAMVGLSAAAMINATAYGTSSRNSMRKLLVKSKVLSTRLSSSIRNSMDSIQPSVAQPESTNILIIWVADTNNDQAKQNNEMQLIERDTTTNELKSYKDEMDVNDFVDAATFRTRALSSYTAETWGTSVTDLSFTLSGSAGATVVTSRLTATQGDLTETTVIAASPRN